MVFLRIILAGIPSAIVAVGDGNDLLPDIPVATYSVALELVADISPSIVIDITNAADGSGRLFLVSPDGVIRILKDGLVLTDLFLVAPASPPDRAMSGLGCSKNWPFTTAKSQESDGLDWMSKKQ